MCKIFQDAMQHPVCKSIVSNHLADDDTQLIWEQICDAMGRSMTAQLRSQLILTFLVSARPTRSGGWKDSWQSHSLHFAVPAHQHNGTSKEPCSSGQLVQFLHASVGGLPNPSPVLIRHKTTKKASGVTSETQWNAMLHSCNRHRHMWQSPD
jgi:hypothetical protein